MLVLSWLVEVSVVDAFYEMNIITQGNFLYEYIIYCGLEYFGFSRQSGLFPGSRLIKTVMVLAFHCFFPCVTWTPLE